MPNLLARLLDPDYYLGGTPPFVPEPRRRRRLFEMPEGVPGPMRRTPEDAAPPPTEGGALDSILAEPESETQPPALMRRDQVQFPATERYGKLLEEPPDFSKIRPGIGRSIAGILAAAAAGWGGGPGMASQVAQKTLGAPRRKAEEDYERKLRMTREAANLEQLRYGTTRQQAADVRAESAEKRAQEAHEREAKDEKVDEYVNQQGQRVHVYQKPDGSTYEKTFGAVAQRQDTNLGTFEFYIQSAGAALGPQASEREVMAEARKQWRNDQYAVRSASGGGAAVDETGLTPAEKRELDVAGREYQAEVTAIGPADPYADEEQQAARQQRLDAALARYKAEVRRVTGREAAPAAGGTSRMLESVDEGARGAVGGALDFLNRLGSFGGETPAGRPPAGAGATPSAGQTDRVTVIAPDGRRGTIPRSQLQEAQRQGYKVVQ